MNPIKWNGNQITEPGLYSGMPLVSYHRADICDGPSVSSSGLRTMWADGELNPAHFWDSWPGNPDHEPKKDAEHFVLGRAAHHIICGQAFFAEEYIIRPDEYEDEKTGEMKPWHNGAAVCKRWNEKAELAGKTILKSEHAETVRAMAIRLGQCPMVQAGILNGLVEHSIFWRDSTGLWLKARPDMIPSASGDFSDLKTTTSCQYIDLMRTVADLGYHQQGALILEGARAIGLNAETFTLIFVEKKRPYVCRPVEIDHVDLALGSQMNRIAIDKVVECLGTGAWPGPGELEIGRLSLSKNARDMINGRLKQYDRAA